MLRRVLERALRLVRWQSAKSCRDRLKLTKQRRQLLVSSLAIAVTVRHQDWETCCLHVAGNRVAATAEVAVVANVTSTELVLSVCGENAKVESNKSDPRIWPSDRGNRARARRLPFHDLPDRVLRFTALSGVIREDQRSTDASLNHQIGAITLDLGWVAVITPAEENHVGKTTRRLPDGANLTRCEPPSGGSGHLEQRRFRPSLSIESQMDVDVAGCSLPSSSMDSCVTLVSHGSRRFLV